MTDPDLLEKRIAFIEAAVARLRGMARLEALQSDLREQGFVLHTLQTAIEAAIDAAAHIVADQHLGEPVTARDVFVMLGQHGQIDHDLSNRLAAMVGFRNVVVHLYGEVDFARVREIVATRLDDLLDFASAVRAKWLGGG